MVAKEPHRNNTSQFQPSPPVIVELFLPAQLYVAGSLDGKPWHNKSVSAKEVRLMELFSSWQTSCVKAIH